MKDQEQDISRLLDKQKIMSKKYGRTLDPRTMTYSYKDGSGKVTAEQCNEREQIKVAAQTLESEIVEKNKSILDSTLGERLALAALKFKFLTFFSK